MTTIGVTHNDEMPAASSVGSPTAVFADEVEMVDASGMLAVLAHRTISTLSSAGLAVALVRAHAAQAGDTDAVAACNEITDLIDNAARTARDRMILRPRAVVARQTLDIRAS